MFDLKKILKGMMKGAWLQEQMAQNGQKVFGLYVSEGAKTSCVALVNGALVEKELSNGNLYAQGGQRIVISSVGRLSFKRLEIGSFMAQHQVLESKIKTSFVINRLENPLFLLTKRFDKNGVPWVEPHHLLAAEKLRADFTYAQMQPKMSANLSGLPQSAATAYNPYGLNPSEGAMAAHARLTLALKGVGQHFADLLLDVCCFLKGIEDVERERNWPQRSGKVVLKMALEALAKHYGLEPKAVGRHKSKRPMHKATGQERQLRH